jgi:tRNA(Ile)-lysidine synthase
LRASPQTRAVEQTWNWRESPQLPLAEPIGGTLAVVPDRHGPLDLDALPDTLSVQGRRGGESLRPAPGARTRKLKTLLQEARVPLAQRDVLPLLYANGKLIAVADRWLDASVHATRDTQHRARLRFTTL